MDTQVTVGMIIKAAQALEAAWSLAYSIGPIRVFERDGLRVPVPWKDERPLSIKEWEALIESFGF